MVQKKFGDKPRGMRVDTELSEVPDSGLEDAEPVVRTGEVAPRDVDVGLSTFIPVLGWLSSDGNPAVWYYAMDGDPATFIQNAGGGAGVLLMTLKGPRLIARVGMTGNFNNVSIDVWDIQAQAWVNVLNLLADASIRDGIDSGNFAAPILTNAIRVTFAPAATNEQIVDVHILTVQEVKGNISLDVSNTPAVPIFVQAQQQIVAEEVASVVGGGGWAPILSATFIADWFDKDATTCLTWLQLTGAVSALVTLNSPLLVARVAMPGSVTLQPTDSIVVSVTPIGAAPVVVYTHVNGGIAPETLDGFDSGNFSPLLAESVTIAITTSGQAGNNSLCELLIMKVIEVKGEMSLDVSNYPAEPLYVQALQQVTNEEIDLANSTIDDPAVTNIGTIASLFDKDMVTEVIMNGLINTGVYIAFNFPILISRVAFVDGPSGPARRDVIITVNDVAGVPHIVYDGSDLGVPTIADGVDSGNFKDQPTVMMAGAPASPIMATGFSIVCGANDAQGTWTISEISVLKTIETKSYVYNEPSAPVFTQDEGVICFDEVWWPNVGMSGVGIPENAKYPFLKIPSGNWPIIAPAGFIGYPFNSPKLIDRIVITGNMVDVATVQLLGLDGFTPVWTGTVPIGLGGLDSGRITPVMATSILITAGAGGTADIYSISLYKVHGVMTEATQDSPLQVEAEQQVVLDELNPTLSNAQSSNITPLDIAPTIDKDLTTGVITDEDAWSVAHVFNAPKLIGRVCVVGENMQQVAVFYTDLNGDVVLPALFPEAPGPFESIDTGNFTPVMATGVGVVGDNTQAGHAHIYEIVTLKVIETKSTISNAPDVPVHTQTQQVVSLDEVDQVATAALLVGDTSGTVPDLFDRSEATEVAFDGVALSGADIRLNAPIMLSRIVVSGGTLGIPNSVVITVYDVAGIGHVVYDGVTNNLGPCAVAGIDTGNFGWQPDVVFSEAPHSPIPTTRITIIDVNGILVPWTISELTLFKTIETKAFVYNEPAEPAFVEDDQHIAEDEIRWSNVTIVGTVTGSPRVPLRKDPTLPPFLIQANASVYYVFNTIHLISRVMMTGGGVGDVSDLTVEYVGIDAAFHALPSVSGSAFGYDSGNFGPVPSVGVRITHGPTGVPDQVEHLAIFKTFETKTANTAAQPSSIQAEQQICRAEMDAPALSAGVTNADVIFDKDRNTSCVMAAGAQSIIWPLTHPILVNRFLLTGALNVISMTAVTPDGTIKTIFLPGTTEISRDTMNIEPFYLSSLTITQGVASPGSLISELIIQKVIEVKSFSQVQLAQLTEFYGQKVYFDPFMNRELAQTTTVNYLLLRRALEVDADNDPAVNNDSTVVTMTSDIADLERINVKFYVPTDDIRAVKKHVTALATVECGANARCTAIKYRVYKNAIATGTLTALTAQKTITFAALSFDGAASRVVAAIMQDLVYAVIEEHSDLVLEISVWGRQVASVAVPAPITLWHRRGLGDCKLIVESVTQTPQVI